MKLENRRRSACPCESNQRLLASTQLNGRRQPNIIMKMKALVLFLGLFISVRLFAAEISVAAAADLKFALDELMKEFETSHSSITVKVTYGSSGNFYAQLQNKAPFDLYFSADIAVSAANWSKPVLRWRPTSFVYAVGRIVVWTPKSSPWTWRNSGIQSLVASVREKNRHRQSQARALWTWRRWRR